MAQTEKNPPANFPGSGKSPGEWNGYLLQYSCLENSMDRGAWWVYNPWGCKELDTTYEWLTYYTHSAMFWGDLLNNSKWNIHFLELYILIFLCFFVLIKHKKDNHCSRIFHHVFTCSCFRVPFSLKNKFFAYHTFPSQENKWRNEKVINRLI